MYLYLITSFILQMPILNQELFSLEMNNPVMSDQRQSSGHGPFFFLSSYHHGVALLLGSNAVLCSCVATVAIHVFLKSFCPS